MIVTVLGVFVQAVMEFPLELYYGAEVTHTTETYSVQPGETTTSFTYYVTRESRGWEAIGIFQAIGISTLFYFACLSVLGLLRWTIRRNRPPKEIPRNKYDDKTYNRLMKIRDMDKNRKPASTIAAILIIALFFYSGRNGLFGLGLEGTGTSSKEQVINFSPTHLIYASNGKGTGDIWMIQEDKSGEGATYISNESSHSFDSIIYTIRTFGTKTEGQKDIDQFIVSKEMSSFDPFFHNDLVWLTARPNMLRAYDIRSGQPTYETSDDFSGKYKELESGIYNFYRHDYNGSDVLRIQTLDGGLYYYHFDSDTLVGNLSDLDTDKSFRRFGLQSANGQRYNLAVANMEQRLVFNGNRKLFEALEESGITVQTSFVKYDVVDSVFFISPELLTQTENRAFILHQKDIRENSLRMISAVDSTANTFWSVNSTEFPYKHKEDYMPGRQESKATVDGGFLIVNFIQDWEAVGMMAIDIGSGEIFWKYDYKDLATSDSESSQ